MRAINEADAWDGSTYRRVITVDGQPIEVALTQEPDIDMPVLRVMLNGAEERRNVRAEVRAALECMLSPELDVDPFYVVAAADPLLAPLAERFRGLRPLASRASSSAS